MSADDEPLTLEEACREIFRGTITPATLRSEFAKGRLKLERIGRRDFVTRAAIREMRKKCQQVQPQKGRASGSDQPASGRDEPSSPPSGSSETMGDLRVALDAALISVERLSKSSKPISRKSTGQRQANVIPLRG